MLFFKFTSKCEWHIKFFNVMREIVPARLYKIYNNTNFHKLLELTYLHTIRTGCIKT